MQTKIELTIQRDMTDDEIHKAQEILVALVSCGGIFGVKGGKTVIHFDAQGIFQGIELDYWPWRRRAIDKHI